MKWEEVISGNTLMSFRKLRIAWSVFWGVACVLLIVLWVRSYRLRDEIASLLTPTNGIYFESLEGRTGLHYYHSSDMRNWQSSAESAPVVDYMRDMSGPRFEFEVSGMANGTITHIAAPYWLVTTSVAILAATPWIRQLRWRFSLRTLLIATTLVAVALGLIVWLR
jgi:hypothetical protein